jgi:nitrite reductase/ring-hydroxylating ferredoxin subunit
VTQHRRSAPLADLAAGRVRRLGSWVVGLAPGRTGTEEPFAVSARCRHQLADLSGGRVDADGCLVCPWHGSRYDVRTGRMVSGPHGFLGYRGPTPGYTGLVAALGKVVPLRRRPTEVVGSAVVVED